MRARTKRKPKVIIPIDDSVGYGGKPPILGVVRGISDEESGTRKPAMRNHNHCTLCLLAHQGSIIPLYHRAGEDLQRDAELSEIAPMRGSSIERVGGGAASLGDVLGSKADARRRKDRALRAVGPEGAAVLNALVIQDLGIFGTAKKLGIDRKAVRFSLKVALGALAVHYGYIG